MSILTANFAVTRRPDPLFPQQGDVTCKVRGNRVMEHCQPTDVFVVYRDPVPPNPTFPLHKIAFENILDIRDNDWLFCTDEDDVTYKVLGYQFKRDVIGIDSHESDIILISGGLLVQGEILGSGTIFGPGKYERQIGPGPFGPFYLNRPGIYTLPMGKIFDLSFKGSTTAVWDFATDFYTDNLTDTSTMFQGCTLFSGDISNWNVSNVTNMAKMFYDTPMNPDISGWDVSNVTNMAKMFSQATKFNQPIENWDVSGVTDMSGMFERAVDFNQPIGAWDVNNVSNMDFMFTSATAFAEDLSTWCVDGISAAPELFAEGAAMGNNPDRLPKWGEPCNCLANGPNGLPRPAPC